MLVPAVGWAAAGGSSSGGTPSGGSASGGSGLAPTDGAIVQPADGDVSATAGGISITTSASGFLRHRLSFRGNVSPSDAGDLVEIERSGHQTGWAWKQTVTATVRSDGSFVAVWHANHIGEFAIRAVLVQPQGGTAADASWPTVDVIVYRRSVATFYGPGFYGHRTACGQVLRRQTLGVANRTLPCGTRVAIYYGGQMIIVPVIDRGPYAHGADWDLTEATAQALGMTETESIGAASLPRAS
jgi:rare lipoprotein A